MRKKIFLLLLIASALPFAAVIVMLHFIAADQQINLARQRLTSVISGVVGFYDRTGTDILSQVQSLTASDDLKRTLLLTDEIGIIDQSALIKSTVNNMRLLNLDYLIVVDPQGKALAQGHEPTIFGISLQDDQIISEALSGQQVHSLGIREIKGEPYMMMLAASAAWFKNRVIGVVIGGIIIDDSYLQDIKSLSGAELILYRNGIISESTISGDFDRMPIDTSSSKISSLNLGSVPYKCGVFPLTDFSDEKIADLMIAIDTYDLQAAFDNVSLIFILFAVGGLILALVIAWGFAHRISKPIAELAAMTNELATGNFDVDIHSKRKDEIGDLIKNFNSMASDLKDYHKKLIDSERMTAFTQMAQKVAHEIKNPLTPIQVSIQDLKRAYDRNDNDFPQIIEKSCHTILEEVSSLARIVKEFSEFARFPAPQLSRENLNDIMSSLATLYTNEIEINRLTLDFSAEKLMMDIDRDQIKRAVHNVLKNALEATAETGQVELKTYIENSFAVVMVTDNGSGFSAQAKKNLFSPYFTTKTDGSGLGLVITKKILSEHNGSIEIDDEVGVGTVIKLKLPLKHDYENTLS
ncbi:MAG: HAMP domain-containing protein [candidate division Zixibacteria bacterium]|nr:HAMP domain-containing protein [candidate division Zixibacteria bacterium]